ncbi:unnamed protein product, partial [Mesorhabditis belari]|uniref:Uncharacterized protein n=1 Tax=Mesorhabditis belari TaxID=2138241 RepID=A0AAF3EGP5_9BILA
MGVQRNLLIHTVHSHSATSGKYSCYQEENPATCCGETEEREKDLDEIVADIEGDTKARQAKKLKKKQKQQIRQQQLEEERKKKDAEQKAQEEADNLRKEQELKEQQARDEEKRKEDSQRQRERDREMKEKGEKEKKKKTKKKAVKTKDSSPIVIEEPVYSEGGLVWQKSTTPPQPEPVKTPKEVKEKRPKRAKKTQEDESLDEDRDGLSSVSVSETATPLHYVDSLGGPTHIEPIDEEAPCYNFMAVGRESIRSTVIPPRTPPSSAIPTGPITPAPSSSGSPHSVEAPPGFEQLGNAHRAAQERRRPEASGLQAALGSGSSLLEQWHMMNADNAEILRSLLSTQAVQSQIGVRRANPAPAGPNFVRQHSAHGFGQNGGQSGDKSAAGRAIVGNPPAIPTEISPPKPTGLFGEDIFGRSLPNQDQFRQMSNVTPSEFNSLKQNGNRTNFGAMNSNRHSLIEPSIFSAFGDFSNSGGRLSVPPDSSRQTSDTPFKIARTSTENMYESDEMFKRCTMDVFKSIWSDAPEEANNKRSEAPSASNDHTNASTSLTGMEFLRHAALSNRPVAADAPSSSNGPSTAFRFKSDVHYGANYTSKFGYRHF